MSLPGFNADSTLYRSSSPYMMSYAPATTGAGVAPQAFAFTGGDVPPADAIFIGGGGLIGGGGFGGGGGIIGGGGGGFIGGGGGGIGGGGGGGFICGNNGQQCCVGATCAPGLVCLGGTCRNPLSLCGASGQTCCPGGGCDPGLVCNQSNTCRRPCGELNQACCVGGVCSSGKVCVNGTCVNPPPCGVTFGGPCCPGGPNGAGACDPSKNLACLGGVCMGCGFRGTFCCPDFLGRGTCSTGQCDLSTFTCI